VILEPEQVVGVAVRAIDADVPRQAVAVVDRLVQLHLQILLPRLANDRPLEVGATAGEIGRRIVRQQRRGLRTDPAGRDLVVRERLAGQGIDDLHGSPERIGDSGEVAGPLRGGRNDAVLGVGAGVGGTPEDQRDRRIVAHPRQPQRAAKLAGDLQIVVRRLLRDAV
jgi:hypothetical protein